MSYELSKQTVNTHQPIVCNKTMPGDEEPLFVILKASNVYRR